MQGAGLLSLFPERGHFSRRPAVALPALSQQIRDGRSFKSDYLRAIELRTAAQWAALLFLILLADHALCYQLHRRPLADTPSALGRIAPCEKCTTKSVLCRATGRHKKAVAALMCTLTGMARYRGALKKIRPKIDLELIHPRSVM